MTYVLGARSLRALEGVHPDLVRVVKEAIQWTTQDFMVVQGVRTKEEAWENWGKGRTVKQVLAKGGEARFAQPSLSRVTWVRDPLATKHLIQASGYGHAVDLVPYPVDWETISKFRAIARAMKEAARRLYVEIEWGGDWVSTKKDWPHFQINERIVL